MLTGLIRVWHYLRILVLTLQLWKVMNQQHRFGKILKKRGAFTNEMASRTTNRPESKAYLHHAVDQ